MANEDPLHFIDEAAQMIFSREEKIQQNKELLYDFLRHFGKDHRKKELEEYKIGSYTF